MTVPSPCIKVCVIDDTGLCTGCHRTLDEVATWSLLDDAEKREVWNMIAKREAKWQPFETRPVDEEILVYLEEPLHNISVHGAHYVTLHSGGVLGIIGGNFDHDCPKPTHWMYPPKPPA